MSNLELEAGKTYVTKANDVAHVVAIVNTPRWRDPIAIGYVERGSSIVAMAWHLGGSWQTSETHTVNDSIKAEYTLGARLFEKITAPVDVKVARAIAQLAGYSSGGFTRDEAVKRLRQALPITLENDANAEALLDYLIKEKVK